MNLKMLPNLSKALELCSAIDTVALEKRKGCAADRFTSILRTVDLRMSVSIQGLAVPITAVNNWLVLQKIMCSV